MSQIDFKEMPPGKIFFKILFPTLLGLVFSTSLIICDGIFVGRALGSEALAAINIAMPVYMIATGIGLMFGIGASVLASIHLANHKIREASQSLTHAVLASGFLALFFSTVLMIFSKDLVIILGGSTVLLPLVLDYMNVFLPFIVLQIILIIGQFIIRLDGSPNYAMLCNAVPALINIVLDYVFIFIFDWGVAGAAWASVFGMIAGILIFIYYMVHYKKSLSLEFGKFNLGNFIQVRKNVIATVNLGFSALLGEIAVSTMFFMGNRTFMQYLEEDGVAAYSIVCYLFPVIYMAVTAITQSAQPIISFNHGKKNAKSISKTLRLSILTALSFSIAISIAFFFFSTPVVSLFLNESSKAHAIAVYGLPYFAIGFIFFAINMVLIGYFQSIELAKLATVFTITRGFVLMVSCFVVLPMFLGIRGIWLAVPAAELFSLLVMIVYHFSARKRIAP